MDKALSKELYKKYFREEENHSITFLGNKLVVLFPKVYIKKKIAEITNKTINILGIFEGYIFDDIDEEDLNKADHKFGLKCPAFITLNPPTMEEMKTTIEDPISGEMYRETYYKLTFYFGETFIQNTIAVQSINVLKKFTDMLFGGHIPSVLTYEDILSSWDLCNRSNGGGDLRADYAMLAIIIASLTRCPDDYTTQFRLKYKKYYEKGIRNGKIVRMNDIPKYSSDFAALTGADAKHGITIAMKNRRVDKKETAITPIEEVIK